MRHAEAPIWVVGAAIVSDGRCFAAQRPPGGSAGLKWEFPGGKVEQGEEPEQALIREVREELGVGIEVTGYLGHSEYRGKSSHIVLDVYLARLTQGEPAPNEHLASRWLGPDELNSVPWALADLPLLPHLETILRATKK